jgi:uncharacterized protein involved in type VI secretion and phage assembly
MQDTLTQVARQNQQHYYGKFRGFVVDNQDPEQRGRLRVRVPSVLADAVTGWALPCLPFGGLANQGLFFVPEVGAQIWVEFEEGNLDRPLWVGVFWQQLGDIPQEGQKTPPTTRVLRTPSGHVLQFDDAAGAEQFHLYHPTGAELSIDAQGSMVLSNPRGARLALDVDGNKVVLEDTNGNSMTLDATGTVVQDSSGNRIEMAAIGISVKGQLITIEGSQVAIGGPGGEPLIKGMSFLTLFATHIHTCTAPGSPSSPPIPQGEISTLTTCTTAK